MNQRPIDQDEHTRMKQSGEYETLFKKTETTFSGFLYDFAGRNTFDDTPEERKAFYHDLLVNQGGFRFWLNTYDDMLKDEKANLEV